MKLAEFQNVGFVKVASTVIDYLPIQYSAPKLA